jgi:hypothetical protein
VDRASVRAEVEPEANRLGKREQSEEHRRHPLAVSDFVRLHGGKRALGIEARHHDDSGSDDHHAHCEMHRRRVIKRRWGKIHGIVIETESVHPADRLPRDCLVDDGQIPDTLGPPGGSGGVKESRACRHIRKFGVAVERQQRNVIVASIRRCGIEDEHLGRVAPGDQSVCDFRERSGHKHDLRGAIANDVDCLVRLQVLADWRVVVPEPAGGPDDLEKSRLVRQHEGDAVARLQAPRL